MATRGRDKFKKFKPAIIFLSKCYKIFPLSVRIKKLERHRKTRGYLGLVIRYALFRSVARKCGDNVSIYPDVYLFSPHKLSVGDNVSIHPMCYIDAVGEIDIAQDVSIAHATTVLSSTHTYADPDMPIKDQPVETKKTVIESNVWIGAKATVLCGNTVHSGSVIAAGAVVTHDVPPNSIVAGIPAKVIKERK